MEIQVSRVYIGSLCNGWQRQVTFLSCISSCQSEKQLLGRVSFPVNWIEGFDADCTASKSISGILQSYYNHTMIILWPITTSKWLMRVINLEKNLCLRIYAQKMGPMSGFWISSRWSVTHVSGWPIRTLLFWTPRQWLNHGFSFVWMKLCLSMNNMNTRAEFI